MLAAETKKKKTKNILLKPFSFFFLSQHSYAHKHTEKSSVPDTYLLLQEFD